MDGGVEAGEKKKTVWRIGEWVGNNKNAEKETIWEPTVVSR